MVSVIYAAVAADRLRQANYLFQFHESVERYCQEIEREGVWADRTVLIALSHMMQRPIVIHHAIDGQDRSERIGSQYRVKATCHCFFTGNHYDFLAQAEGNREPAPERRMNDRDMGVYLEELYVPDDSADTFDYVIEHPMPR